MEPTDTPPAITPDLFRLDPSSGALTLLGGRHHDSGRLVFPLAHGADWTLVDLPRHGRLWSFTVQRFRPKSPPYAGPDAFEPYAVGYVDLGPLIVEGRLTGAGLDGFHIGMPMQAEPLVLDLIGPPRRVMTYAFAPAGDAP